MQNTIESIVARVRDRFSTTVLGTTTPEAPETLDYRLPIAHRALISGIAFALGAALAYLALPYGGALSALFFFPALTIAGLFGGLALAVPFLVLAIALDALSFSHGPSIVTFALAAVVQLGASLVLRALFHESRRWALRYRRLISAIATATAISDAEGRMTRPQPELGRLLGRDWPGYADHRWLEMIHPEDRELLPHASSNVTRGVHRAEVRLKTTAGEDWRWHLLRATPLLRTDGTVEEWTYIITDIHSRRIGQEQTDLAFGEMRHRLKNLMTIVRSLATSTKPRGDKTVEAFLQKYFGRLDVLTIAAEEVIVHGHVAIEAGAVIRATLAPFVDGTSRVTTQGPYCLLSEQTGGLLALGMHELATNAIKYGALSVPEGSVSVKWSREPVANGERINLEWTERDGPSVQPPAREGFGSRILRFIPAHEREGKVDIDYRPEGLICRISFVQKPIAMAATATSE